MARAGREFEELVARIEERLCPLGATVTSPGKIKDRVTGALREVDVAIRYTLGSAPILLTIECRDRTAVQDITWLEQVKSKKDSMAANQTIVVSREGFSQNAIQYARHHGIILRQMSAVTDSFLLQCIQGLKVYTRNIRSKMISYNIGFYALESDAGLKQLSVTESVELAIKQNRPFAINRRGEELTLNEIFRELLPEFESELTNQYEAAEGLKMEDLVEGICEAEAYFEPNDIAVETTVGTRFLQQINFQIKYEIKNDLLPALTPVAYTDEKGRVIDSFSMTADPGGSPKVFLKLGWDR